jgi:ketosteroid isomerase-like protein
MQASEILKVIDALYDLSARGDFDAAEAHYLSDDLVITEASDLPMGGVYRGRRALRDLYEKVMGFADVAALERHASMTGSDCAVVHLHIAFADPDLAPAEVLELFRFRDGKVCEIKPFYFDSTSFVRAHERKRRRS